MPPSKSLAKHYTHGDLLEAIKVGLKNSGKTIATVSVESLSPVDEFHIGGRVATKDFLDQVGIEKNDHVLDIGSGLGGASRFAAQNYSCRITGIDLTPEFVETGSTLCSWVGLADRITLELGNATATDFSDGMFDKAYMLHVGMNIKDKPALANELFRILKPGGTFGIYDVMRVGSGEMVYPVPWAGSAAACCVDTPEKYCAALEQAGFRITTQVDRREFALEFFAKLQSNLSMDGPPPLGLHILMGESTPAKLKNMMDLVSQNILAPFELIAQKPGSPA